MEPPCGNVEIMVCGICGSSHADRHLRIGGYSLVKCRKCGLIRTAGFRPYGSLYTGDSYFAGENGYIAREERFRSIFGSLLDKIVRFGGHGTLLDVGTGVGILLDVARDRGFVVRGVEVSDWASGYARKEKGLDVATGTLEEARFGKGSFDVVVINHVLEHLPEPRATLAEIRRILADDGLLVVGVPNAGSLFATLLGPRWASWRPEQHVWHFTPATLYDLVRRSRFRVDHREARENSIVEGHGIKAIAQRIINSVAVLTNRSEAMLLFARKDTRSDE